MAGRSPDRPVPVAGSFEFDGVAIVTGGGGGTGRVIAHNLHARGARVLVVGTNATKGAATAAELERGAWFACDLTSEGAAARVVDACVERFGQVDALVNNAGVFPSTPFGTVTAEVMREVFAVNVIAPMLLMQAVAARVAEQGSGGAIVNITSLGAFRPNSPSMLAYDASKAALSALTRDAALHLAPRGVRVNAVAPGPIDLGEPGPGWAGLSDAEHEALLQSLADRVPIRRRIRATEVADAVAFLVSPAASGITGITVHVDGGAAI